MRPICADKNARQTGRRAAQIQISCTPERSWRAVSHRRAATAGMLEKRALAGSTTSCHEATLLSSKRNQCRDDVRRWHKSDFTVAK